MKLILHIGVPKTGSTSIQESLRDLSGYFESVGIFYPLVPGAGIAHNHLCLIDEGKEPPLLVRNRYRDDPRSHARIGAEILDGLIRRVEARPEGIHTVVLSSEMWFLRPGILENDAFAQFIAGFERTQVMCYVRQPSAHYLSALQQRLKSGPYLKPLKRPAYKEVLERLGSRHELVVRLFARTSLAGGDVVQDFTENVLGVRLPAGFRTPSSNASFSSAGMVVLREWQAGKPKASWGLHDRSFRIFERRLRAAEAALKPAPPLRLNDAIAGWLDAPSEDLCYLRDRFGISLVDAAPDVPSEKPHVANDTPLEAIMEVDHARVGKLREMMQEMHGGTEQPQTGRGPEAARGHKRPAKACRTAVVVLGMHRSGTSALSGLLSILGCELPAHPMPPNDSNTSGYFESQEFYRLHNEMLAAAGSSWDDWRAFDRGWLDGPDAADFRIRAAKTLKGEFGAAPVFVLKDPRVCRFLPFWRRILDEAGCAVKVIHTHRNPLDVADSLAKRDRLPCGLGTLIWLRHVLDSERDSRGADRGFTSYRQLLHDWRGVAKKLGEGLDLTWPYDPDAVAAEADDFLNDRLMHFNGPEELVLESPLTGSWVHHVYTILEHWAEAGERVEDHATLDRIRTEFDSAAPTFAAVVEAARPKRGENAEVEKQRDAATLKRDLDKLRAELGEVGDRLAKNEVALAENRKATERLRQELEQTDRRAEAAEIALAENRKAAERLRQELQQKDMRAKAAEFAVASMRQSTSWRLTAPLRGIGTRLRRKND